MKLRYATMSLVGKPSSGELSYLQCEECDYTMDFEDDVNPKDPWYGCPRCAYPAFLGQHKVGDFEDEDGLMVRIFQFRHPFGFIRINQLLASDNNRPFHDHPWHWFGIVLSGGYDEETPYRQRLIRRKPGTFYFAHATRQHRLHLINPEKPSWSVIFTTREFRMWGFLVPLLGGPGYRWVSVDEYYKDSTNKL